MQIRIYRFINIKNLLLLMPREFLFFVVLLFFGFYLWLPKTHTRAWPQSVHMHLIKRTENADGNLFTRMFFNQPFGFLLLKIASLFH